MTFKVAPLGDHEMAPLADHRLAPLRRSWGGAIKAITEWLHSGDHQQQQRLLIFEAPEFLVLLEMATIFQEHLHPAEREMVREVCGLADGHEKAFHWGRLMGALSIQARDILSDWELRKWPEHRIKSLYELAEYVKPTG
jgi:hypothetical protein